MKRVVFYSFLVVLCTLGAFTATYAQHIISIQSADRQAFTIQVNGSKLNSSRTGSVRIGNLSAGNYSLVIKPSGQVPAQSFTCIVDNSDLSYSFINDAQKGWMLKDTKSAEELTAVGAVAANPPPVSVPTTSSVKGPKQPAGNAHQAAPLNSPFALMLAQVVHDPELLNSTPWVLSTKVDGNDDATNSDGSNNIFAEQVANDTSTYEAATKGIIKASQKYIKGGTEMTFVDFTATSGDTVHIMVPSTDTSAEGEEDDPAAAVKTATTKTATAKTGTAPQQQVVAADTTTKEKARVVTGKEEAVAAFDTSSNKQYSNPFFTKPVDSKQANKPEESQPADTKKTAKPAESKPATDVTITPYTEQPAEKDKGKKNKKDKGDDKVAEQPAAKDQQPAVDAQSSSSTPVTKTAVKSDCKKTMSDNEQEKLKHKIYLETDQDKIMEITRKAIAGKCITTAQVKDLAGLFLTDDGRYHLFYTVYPNVYDLSSFSTLRTYMIDAKYKAMFDALVK